MGLRSPPRVYLAGFEVFFCGEKEENIAVAKKRICSEWGLEGIFPGDAAVRNLPAHEMAAEIYNKDVEIMKSCDAICANLTPFRGVSADAGTCWELGHFVGAGKPAVAYTNDARTYEQRVPASMMAATVATPPLDVWGMKVDMQGEADNCMMTRCVTCLAVAKEVLTEAEMLVDLRAFEESISALSGLFLTRSNMVTS